MSDSPFEGPSAPLPDAVIRFATLPEETQRLLLRAAELLGSIDYGAVILTIHDGRVVQVEMSEKIRLR
jgi:hypothetical protein